MKFINKLINDTKGLAFIESALILPLLIALLFGLFDLGQAIIINQKVTSAAHSASNLITRKRIITSIDLDDALGVAQLIIDPYDRGLLGIDIAGIQFDDNDSPEEIWRYTYNMTANGDIPNGASGLGINGEGLVVTSVTYTYTPLFSGSIIGPIDMKEVSYMRGRITSVVRLQEN